MSHTIVCFLPACVRAWLVGWLIDWLIDWLPPNSLLCSTCHMIGKAIIKILFQKGARSIDFWSHRARIKKLTMCAPAVDISVSLASAARLVLSWCNRTLLPPCKSHSHDTYHGCQLYTWHPFLLAIFTHKSPEYAPASTLLLQQFFIFWQLLRCIRCWNFLWS